MLHKSLTWLLGAACLWAASVTWGSENDPRPLIQATLDSLQAIAVDYKDVYSEPTTHPSNMVTAVAKPLAGPRIVSKRNGRTVFVNFMFLDGSAFWDTKLSEADIRAGQAQHISPNEERIWVSNEKSSEELIKRVGGRSTLGDIRAGAQLPPASALELGLGLRRGEFEGWLPPKDISLLPYSRDGEGRAILHVTNDMGQQVELVYDPGLAYALVEYRRIVRGVVVADVASSDFRPVQGRSLPFAVTFIRRSLKGMESSRHTVSVSKYSFDVRSAESPQLHIKFPKMKVTDLRTGDTFSVIADKTALTDELLAKATANGPSPAAGAEKLNVVLIPHREVAAALLRRPSTETGRRGELLVMALAAVAIALVGIALWKRLGRNAAHR